jgi:hypothetical protein
MKTALFPGPVEDVSMSFERDTRSDLMVLCQMFQQLVFPVKPIKQVFRVTSVLTTCEYF